jgi:hypothetical protein
MKPTRVVGKTPGKLSLRVSVPKSSVRSSKIVGVQTQIVGGCSAGDPGRTAVRRWSS